MACCSKCGVTATVLGHSDIKSDVQVRIDLEPGLKLVKQGSGLNPGLTESRHTTDKSSLLTTQTIASIAPVNLLPSTLEYHLASFPRSWSRQNLDTTAADFRILPWNLHFDPFTRHSHSHSCAMPNLPAAPSKAAHQSLSGLPRRSFNTTSHSSCPPSTASSASFLGSGVGIL